MECKRNRSVFTAYYFGSLPDSTEYLPASRPTHRDYSNRRTIQWCKNHDARLRHSVLPLACRRLFNEGRKSERHKSTGRYHAPRYQLSVAAESLSLRQAEQIAGAKIGPSQGTIHLEASAYWTSSLQNLIAHADVGISALIDPDQYSAASANAMPLPVNGDLHVTYDAPRATLAVTNSPLSSNGTSVVALGTISDHSELSLRARTSDLHEVDLLAIADIGFSSPSVSGYRIRA